MNRYIVIVFLLFLCSSTFAQNAYFYEDSLLMAIPTFTQKEQNLATMQQKYSAEVSENRSSLQKQLNRLIGPYGPKDHESFDELKLRMKDIDTLKLNILLADDKGISKKEQAYNNIVKLEYQKNIEPLQQLVHSVIIDYAKQHKIEAVYIIENLKQSLAYLDPMKIITKQLIGLVLKKYNSRNSKN